MKEEERKNNYPKIKKKSDNGSLGRANDKYELSRLRIIQKNLLYVIGLSPEIAKEELLMQPEYFGQYGKITKIVVNKLNAYNPNGPNGPSYSAYVTFSNDRDASLAIYAINEFKYHNREIKASFGTTKYCTFFLNEDVCPNSDCLYLHSIGKDRESFTKDYIVNNRNIFSDQQKIAASIIKKNKAEIMRLDQKKQGNTIFPSVRQVLERLQSESQYPRKNSDNISDFSDKNVRKYSEDIAMNNSQNSKTGLKNGSKRKVEKLINTVDFGEFNDVHSVKSENNKMNEKKSDKQKNNTNDGDTQRTPTKNDQRSMLNNRMTQSESKNNNSVDWKGQEKNQLDNSFTPEGLYSNEDEEEFKPLEIFRAQSSPAVKSNQNEYLNKTGYGGTPHKTAMGKKTENIANESTSTVTTASTDTTVAYSSNLKFKGNQAGDQNSNTSNSSSISENCNKETYHTDGDNNNVNAGKRKLTSPERGDPEQSGGKRKMSRSPSSHFHDDKSKSWKGTTAKTFIESNGGSSSSFANNISKLSFFEKRGKSRFEFVEKQEGCEPIINKASSSGEEDIDEGDYEILQKSLLKYFLSNHPMSLQDGVEVIKS